MSAPPTVAELSELLVSWLHRLMPAGARRDGLTADLAATFAGSREPLDAVGCRAVQDVAQRRQWWTVDQPAGTALTQPVTVLVGPRTYSSAEALAYHLQARGRVTVLGEPTRGAADHVTPVRLTRHVLGLLPEAEVRDAVTGGNWEGTGVVPDIFQPHAGALEAALRRPVS
ncbi:S41 family peptidase [Actinoplanes sp. NPDC049599]|uniref:S41 family peptidase n=1 Tax=Actinoplanes sp. NPDC049599 TaxID=3363903 RepID=UPI0037994180